MADRSWHGPNAQGIKHVYIPFRVAASATGTNPATFVEGDKLDASTGSYIVSSKVATGKYRFKTVDKFLGLVSVTSDLHLASPDGNQYCETKLPLQNTDKTWQFEVWVYANAAGTFSLADLTAADQISVSLVLRDSQVRP